MKLNELPGRRSVRKRKRVGRGTGSGHGKTSGRGQKGQKSRSSGQIPVAFSGGGISLFRRLPKLGGFKPLDKIHYVPVNVAALNIFDDGDEITLLSLREKRLIKKNEKKVKILGDGELNKKLFVRLPACSQSAEEKILKAGGELIRTQDQ
ncbi:MAG: 50S ribosomal protein L15 [bacterium]